MSRCLALLAFLMATAGCQGMRTQKSNDFIEPLAMNNRSVGTEQATPESERQLCIQTAKTVAARGHFSEAIALYEQAEKLDSRFPPLDRELAPLHAERGQVEKAVTRYQRAIQATPDDAALWNNFAWTLLESNRSAQAINVVEEALVHFPTHRRLLSTRAVASYRAGDREDAIERFAELYGPSVAYHNIALLDVESGDLANARSAVQQSLAHNGTSESIQLASAIENVLSLR